MRISDWSSDVCSSDLATRPSCPAPTHWAGATAATSWWSSGRWLAGLRSLRSSTYAVPRGRRGWTRFVPPLAPRISEQRRVWYVFVRTFSSRLFPTLLTQFFHSISFFLFSLTYY